MTTLTNDFHNTRCNIRANVGDAVSEATIRRARKALCRWADCLCANDDGTRGGRYRIIDGVVRDLVQEHEDLNRAKDAYIAEEANRLYDSAGNPRMVR